MLKTINPENLNITGLNQRIREHSKQIAFVSFIIFVAFFLRLVYIDQPWQGDDYNTIRESINFGRNLNGLLYFGILHFWMQIIQTEWWYRLLGVCIGLAAIPLAYWAGTIAGGQRAGVIYATFLAFSPFAIDTTHLLRTYSAFLTCSLFAITATLYFVTRRDARFRLHFLVISLILLPLSHILGLLLAGAILLFLYCVSGYYPGNVKQRVLLVLLLLSIAAGVFLYPPLRIAGWNIIQQSIGSLRHVDYQSARGISIAQTAKIPISLFMFTLGNGVYPLTWWLVIPALLITSAAAILGIFALRRQPAVLALIFVVLCLVPLIFLVLDALVPSGTETAGPRHVTMAFPAFLLLVACGMTYWRKPILPVLFMVVLIVSLAVTWTREWSYGGEVAGPDWHAAANFAAANAQGQTLLLFDGRSADPVEYYFPVTIPRQSLWEFAQGRSTSQLAENERVIIVANDYQAARRQDIDRLLELLSNRFSILKSRIEYPLFMYVLERKPADTVNVLVNAENGQIAQPLETYGLEFQDLELPAPVDIATSHLSINGAFSLSSQAERSIRSISLIQETSAQHITILANVLYAEAIAHGTEIATLTVEAGDGTIQTFPLRYGIDVEDWSHSCAVNSNCRTIYQWHKRIALVGQQSYPGAWRDFMAGIHTVSINLPRISTIKKLTFHYGAPIGNMYIWGIGLY